eukprot:TRINITY_DN18282_c0_g1_i2.p1 TRINITY_DN18282_c0_g1~~TRINITY_DN18282_c0_g1_i2.p1  ORF type:complete len:326 (+),score=85.08 TRINITY_DN18282_c0_g1_i2:244-1221(+)
MELLREDIMRQVLQQEALSKPTLGKPEPAMLPALSDGELSVIDTLYSHTDPNASGRVSKHLLVDCFFAHSTQSCKAAQTLLRVDPDGMVSLELFRELFSKWHQLNLGLGSSSDLLRAAVESGLRGGVLAAMEVDTGRCSVGELSSRAEQHVRLRAGLKPIVVAKSRVDRQVAEAERYHSALVRRMDVQRALAAGLLTDTSECNARLSVEEQACDQMESQLDALTEEHNSTIAKRLALEEKLGKVQVQVGEEKEKLRAVSVALNDQLAEGRSITLELDEVTDDLERAQQQNKVLKRIVESKRGERDSVRAICDMQLSGPTASHSYS